MDLLPTSAPVPVTALTNALVDTVDAVDFVDVADVLHAAGTVKALGYVKGAWVVPAPRETRGSKVGTLSVDSPPFIPRLSIPCYSLPRRYFRRHATFCYFHWT